MSVCVCAECGSGGGGLGGWEEGVIRILQSLIGVIRSIYHERTKILLPHPSPPGDE